MKASIRRRKAVLDAELLVRIKTFETQEAAFILSTSHEKLVPDAWLFRDTTTTSTRCESLEIVFIPLRSPKGLLRGVDLLV
jgi:hypothetical protein